MKRLKLIAGVIVLFIIVIIFYVTGNLTNMTLKQKILKTFYPALMWITRVTGTNTTTLAKQPTQAPVSFYKLQTTLSDGSTFSFAGLRGKKVLLVNTASDCGYTGQYADLEKLYRQYRQQVEILAFPANDFKEQEKSDDAAIAKFCKINYGVTFPIMAKSIVIKSGQQNPVFSWLTKPEENGWNSKAPSWNFSKYLVTEAGELVGYFDPGISPLSEDVINAITKE